MVSSGLDSSSLSSYLYTTVQNTVRDHRSRRDLSQGALAKAMGVSRQTINAIETGRYLPSLPLAIALARHFGKPVEEIFHVDSENSDE